VNGEASQSGSNPSLLHHEKEHWESPGVSWDSFTCKWNTKKIAIELGLRNSIVPRTQTRFEVRVEWCGFAVMARSAWNSANYLPTFIGCAFQRSLGLDDFESELKPNSE
jgi:hypothetical protein